MEEAPIKPAKKADLDDIPIGGTKKANQFDDMPIGGGSKMGFDE